MTYFGVLEDRVLVETRPERFQLFFDHIHLIVVIFVVQEISKMKEYDGFVRVQSKSVVLLLLFFGDAAHRRLAVSGGVCAYTTRFFGSRRRS